MLFSTLPPRLWGKQLSRPSCGDTACSRSPSQRTSARRSSAPRTTAMARACTQRHLRLGRQALPADTEGVSSMALDAEARAVRRCRRSVHRFDVCTERIALMLRPDRLLAITRHVGEPAAAWTGDHAANLYRTCFGVN